MSVFSTERPVSALELKAMQEQKQAEYKANRQLMKAQRILEEEEAKNQEKLRQQDAEQKEKEKREQALAEAAQRYQMESANRAYAKAVSSLPKTGRESLIKGILYNIMVESLWVDDAVKNSPEFTPQTIELFEQVIDRCDKATGSSLLANMESTRLLSYINDVATECANMVCDRILTEAKEIKPITIEFNPNADEMDVVEKKLADATPQNISKLVKTKVLGIIKDEKEEGKIKAELFQELDDAGKDDEEESGESNDIAESLIGIPMDQVLEAIEIKAEDTPVYEHIVTKLGTLAALADKECISGNFDKAKACYEQVEVLEHQMTSLYGYQGTESLLTAMKTITEALDSRMFNIKPGTGKAIRRESVEPVVVENLSSGGDQLVTYCKGMTRAISNRNVVTETLDEIRNRLARKNANQALHASIGNTLFESMMIKNSINVKNALTESGSVSLLGSEVQNAAFLQSIVEYTMFETLNTMQVYKFDKESVSKLKGA